MSTAHFEHELQVQYRDLDPRSHVNHAHYVSYLEEGKQALFSDVVGTPLSEAGTAIRHLEVDYEAPILAEQDVTVRLGPVRLGETSFTIDYELHTDEARAATASTVSVLLDDDGRPRSLPEQWRTALAPYREDGD